MSDGLGKIKKAKKALYSVGKKQVLGGVGKKPLERWGALDGWDANTSAKRSYFFFGDVLFYWM